MHHSETRTFDDLSRRLPNMNTFVTSTGDLTIYDPQRQTSKTTTISMLDFTQFKKLKKLPFDINHFIPEDKPICPIFFYLVYGKEEVEDQENEEAYYYKYVPRDYQQEGGQDYTFSETDSFTISQYMKRK